MENFIIKELKTDNVLRELNDIGFDKSYAENASEKYKYKNIKIFDLTAAQANILKQTALSVGADCATPKGTVAGNIDSADCILGGSLSQLNKIAVKLGVQPFGLRKLGRKIEDFLEITDEKETGKTKIMGILNVTDNSFSDGGLYLDYDTAIERLNQMIEDGADMIDIGAESTKPKSEPVPISLQIERLIPLLDYVTDNNIDIPISIDTRSAEVARECLNAGATAINDVSGLTFDKNMVKVIADYNCPIIIQHSKGTPDIMQDNPQYENLMDEIYKDLYEKITFAVSNGINKDNIIVDPGIGFGKTRKHNFEILRRVEELKGLGCPIMLGLSRKSILDMQDADNGTKDIYTLALNAIAVENKVDIIRVHNVILHKQLLIMLGK